MKNSATTTAPASLATLALAGPAQLDVARLAAGAGELLRQATVVLSRWRALLPEWAKPALDFTRHDSADTYYAANFTFAQYRRAIDPFADRTEFAGMVADLGRAW